MSDHRITVQEETIYAEHGPLVIRVRRDDLMVACVHFRHEDNPGAISKTEAKRIAKMIASSMRGVAK